VELLRTLLFVPGNRESMIQKARLLPADVLVLDLEDSVPLEEKGRARELVRRSISGLALAGQKVFVRVNPIAGGLAEDDLKAVVCQGLDGISLPKVDSGEDIERVDALLNALERGKGLKPGYIKLIPWVETAKAILNAFEIASSSSRVAGIAFGAEDFTRDMEIVRSKVGDELLYPRSMVAIAAKAAGVAALDTPYTEFKDEQGLIEESKLARKLGFRGKFVIHPSQIEPVNQIFSPSPEEVAHARRVVEAFEAAKARGSAATSLDGMMIDTPIAERARRLLMLAQAITNKEEKTRNVATS